MGPFEDERWLVDIVLSRFCVLATAFNSISLESWVAVLQEMVCGERRATVLAS